VSGPAGPASAAEHPAEPLRILLVGRVSPRKVTDVAVEAMALLRRGASKAVLDVVRSVFGGYEWFEERVRALIRAEGLEDSVRLTSFRRCLERLPAGGHRRRAVARRTLWQ
jgi:glycosyltransferase involved in cell wall biosynthesis